MTLECLYKLDQINIKKWSYLEVPPLEQLLEVKEFLSMWDLW